ncbi:AIPR family protein [Vibrio fluvialis]|uniref:AIPR family protein n=1 Tax=Vibrio sp. bablab_jr001 TaxID=2755067 RepID=UPI0018F11281|nr:AIPR family protein [Vibrio sp. bablab_jr001]EKO3398653.1 AIPR family protein [Vibrio fluvialis]EKO3471902.1 AIPR family protein [Vibrio fluvialis]MBY8115417.1 AIPR family protein [Vibrio fluvialis]MBY8248509.1 AIPR family protein [Vibrio fluvialis]MBY8282178.1 AIPR family protein [Vibrio fluvialis]
MAFVTELTPEDNATPATATANLMATRLGTTLRERFESFIHKRECSVGQSDYNVKMASRAIAAFVVHHLGQVDDNVSGASVCDSSQDGGIDAIHVNHTEKTVVVVQAKYSQSGSSTWTNADFLVFKQACDHLIEEEYDRFDPILRNKREDISQALGSIDYKFLFVMAHTGKRGAASTILSDMQQWQDELNEAASLETIPPNHEQPFQVHLVSSEDITQWRHAQTSATIDLEDIELEQYGKIDNPYTAFFGVVSGDQIAEWWQLHSSKLFTKNIRNLLGKTEVNESIKQTALNDPEHFWFYNNGITVLVRSVEPHRRNKTNQRDMGRFNFRDVSVINGAQTVSSIGSLDGIDDDTLANIKVQVRFIQIPQGAPDDIINSITRANNHQNRVLGRDFASQHPQQVRLRDELIIEDYIYQLLRSDISSDSLGDKSIDIDEALDALACLSCRPSTLALLKSQRGKFFENLEGSAYKAIFNSSVSGIKLINAVTHQRVIEHGIKELLGQTNRQTDKKRYGILTHANRVFAGHILRTTPNLQRATNIMQVDESRITTELSRILSVTEALIESEFPTAYPARFFSNVDKITLILERINQ